MGVSDGLPVGGKVVGRTGEGIRDGGAVGAEGDMVTSNDGDSVGGKLGGA